MCITASWFPFLQESKVKFTSVIILGPHECLPDFSLCSEELISLNNWEPSHREEKKKIVCQYNMTFEHSLISFKRHKWCIPRKILTCAYVTHYSLGRLMYTPSGRCTPVHWGSLLVHLNWPQTPDSWVSPIWMVWAVDWFHIHQNEL